MHENINEYTNKMLRAVWVAALQILCLAVSMIFEKCAHAVAVSIPARFYSIKLRVNSKQLVSEFLQDALSKQVS